MAEELTVNVTVEVLLVVVGLKGCRHSARQPGHTENHIAAEAILRRHCNRCQPVLDRLRLSADAELDSKKEGCPDVPVKSLIRCCPAGEPHPVARSYPLTAENPPSFPLLMCGDQSHSCCLFRSRR